VAAVSKSDVWAVGAGADHPIIEHWNGSHWRLIYNSTGPAGELRGVTAISSTDVWASGSSPQNLLTEHWNGKRWQAVSAPSVGDYSSFFGVGGIGATAVWSVGSDNCVSNCNGGPLIESWDGSRWKVVYAPDNGDDHELYGVTALSPTDVWTVGRNLDSSGREHGLSVHWNGSGWKVVRTAKTAVDTELDGATGFGSSVWAVGVSGSASVIERLTAC
jgi:hypothetical protein